MHKILFILCLMILPLFSQSQDMDNEKLGKIIYVLGDTVAGQTGNWSFLVDSLVMFCVTDEFHNRMRIITPIKEIKDISKEEMQACLEANFHSALDVKYAISEDVMWAAFIHPLKELTKDQVIDGIRQLYNASLTYGTYYSSTELIFPKSEQKRQEEEAKRQKKKLKKS